MTERQTHIIRATHKTTSETRYLEGASCSRDLVRKAWKKGTVHPLLSRDYRRAARFTVIEAQQLISNFLVNDRLIPSTIKYTYEVIPVIPTITHSTTIRRYSLEQDTYEYLYSDMDNGTLKGGSYFVADPSKAATFEEDVAHQICQIHIDSGLLARGFELAVVTDKRGPYTDKRTVTTYGHPGDREAYLEECDDE